MTIRKLKSVCSALLLAAALLSGCVDKPGEPVNTRPTPTPEPVTASSLLSDMGRALLERQGASAKAEGSMVFAVPGEGGEREFRAELSLNAETAAGVPALHAEGTAGMEVLGLPTRVPVELYALEDKDGAVICLSVLGQWTKAVVPVTGLGAAAPASPAGNALLAQAAALEEDMETVNGRGCYRLDFPITGEMLSAASEGLALPLPESAPELNAVLWVDGETRLPARLSLTLTKPLVSRGMTIRELALTVDYTAFGPVSITPPPEALNAPEAGQ